MTADPKFDGAVILNQPTPEPTGPNFVDGALYLLGYAEDRKANAYYGEAKAEFTLAIRHLEDAAMRFNRAVAIEAGILHIGNLETALAVAHGGEGVTPDAA